MKRSLLAFAMTLMLAASLAACSNTPADNNANNGTANNGNTTGTVENGDAAARTRSGTGYTGGDYYAAGDGWVTDWTGENPGVYGPAVGNPVQRAADDVANGVRGVGNAVGDTVYDLTHE